MNVRWTKSATRQWEETFEYIETDNPIAARRIAESVFDVIDILAVHPHAGRLRKTKVTRQFAVPRLPYVIAYELDLPADILWVVAVFDGRRRWPKSFPKE
ncbi:MAG: type II toxin-antitoxin system RelE/ParE family toxin [Acidobacteriaceae bacterium]